MDSESGRKGKVESESLYRVQIATNGDGDDETCAEVYHEAENGREGLSSE